MGLLLCVGICEGRRRRPDDVLSELDPSKNALKVAKGGVRTPHLGGDAVCGGGSGVNQQGEVVMELRTQQNKRNALLFRLSRRSP